MMMMMLMELMYIVDVVVASKGQKKCPVVGAVAYGVQLTLSSIHHGLLGLGLPPSAVAAESSNNCSGSIFFANAPGLPPADNAFW